MAQPVSVAGVKPTSANTVAEIKSYLDDKGISYTSSMSKSQLLELVGD
ncbi:HeH/LEM domain-containing protein [Ligilactobacillus equi]